MYSTLNIDFFEKCYNFLLVPYTFRGVKRRHCGIKEELTGNAPEEKTREYGDPIRPHRRNPRADSGSPSAPRDSAEVGRRRPPQEGPQVAHHGGTVRPHRRALQAPLQTEARTGTELVTRKPLERKSNFRRVAFLFYNVGCMIHK